MKSILQKVMDGQTLSRDEAADALRQLTSGTTPPEMIAGFLGAIRSRRETSDELVGFITAARELAVPMGELPAGAQGKLPALLMDVCGTGGDGIGTFNISTTVAFVVAGAGSGVGVAKHGNRSVSSRSGSADVLEALGVRTDLDPPAVLSQLARSGFGFFFAPKFHPAFRQVGPVRKAMGVRTVFNLLGPLVNPARVKRQVMGIYDAEALRAVAMALRDTGTEEAMVFCSEDGLDELSLTGPTHVIHVKGGELRSFGLLPEDAGLPRSPVAALLGGDAKSNAEILTKILEGEKGPRRDVVVYNAAAALVVAGLARTVREGARLAETILDSGAAARALELARETKS
jgi:anthranilate phosphoribosyltransferase